MLHFNLGDIISSAEFPVTSSCLHTHSWWPDCIPKLVVDYPSPQLLSHPTFILLSVQGAHLVPHFRDWAYFAGFQIEPRNLGSKGEEMLFLFQNELKVGPKARTQEAIVTFSSVHTFLPKQRILPASDYWREGRLPSLGSPTPNLFLETQGPLTGLW